MALGIKNKQLTPDATKAGRDTPLVYPSKFPRWINMRLKGKGCSKEWHLHIYTLSAECKCGNTQIAEYLTAELTQPSQLQALQTAVLFTAHLTPRWFFKLI